MGYSAIQFGYCALALGIAWMSGNTLNRLITGYSKAQKITIFAKATVIISCLAFTLSLFSVSLWGILIPTILLNIFGGVIFSSYYAINISMFPMYAGNSSGLMSAGFLMFTSLSGSLLGMIIPDDQIAGVLFSDLLLSIICWQISRVIFSSKKPSKTR